VRSRFCCVVECVGVFAIYVRCLNCSAVVGLYVGMIRRWASCMICCGCMVNMGFVIGWSWLCIHILHRN
jgi:hypothetical protein